MGSEGQWLQTHSLTSYADNRGVACFQDVLGTDRHNVYLYSDPEHRFPLPVLKVYVQAEGNRVKTKLLRTNNNGYTFTVDRSLKRGSNHHTNQEVQTHLRMEHIYMLVYQDQSALRKRQSDNLPGYADGRSHGRPVLESYAYDDRASRAREPSGHDDRRARSRTRRDEGVEEPSEQWRARSRSNHRTAVPGPSILVHKEDLNVRFAGPGIETTSGNAMHRRESGHNLRNTRPQTPGRRQNQPRPATPGRRLAPALPYEHVVTPSHRPATPARRQQPHPPRAHTPHKETRSTRHPKEKEATTIRDGGRTASHVNLRDTGRTASRTNLKDAGRTQTSHTSSRDHRRPTHVLREGGRTSSHTGGPPQVRAPRDMGKSHSHTSSASAAPRVQHTLSAPAASREESDCTIS